MNKKFVATVVAAATLIALIFCFAACGDDGSETGENSAVPHSITIDAADDVVAFASAASATAGTSVTVTVRPPTWKIVTFVTGSGVECEKDEAASTATETVFTFTMPDKDVELTVETMDSGVSVNEDNRMTWVVAPTQIAPSEFSNDKATFEINFGGGFLATTDKDGNLSNVTITSTNQDVIPDEAIDGADRIGDEAYTDGATFSVDLTKVSLGATTLIFEDTYGHRTITKYVKVVESGTVDPGNIINTTLAVRFDFNERDLKLADDIDPEKLVVSVSVYDADWVDGTDPAYGAEEYTRSRFLLSDTGIKTFALSYIEGHRYSVNVALFTYTDDYETDMYPEFSQVYGNTFNIYDYVAGAGNSIMTDEDGVSWLKITGAQSTVTIQIDVA